MEKAEYMKLFKTFSPAKQRRHIAIAVAYALWLLQDKPSEQPPFLMPPRKQLDAPKQDG